MVTVWRGTFNLINIRLLSFYFYDIWSSLSSGWLSFLPTPVYIASESTVGWKHKCLVTLCGANSFGISQSWFTNDQSVCKLCKCLCCLLLSPGYFPFVPHHSWLIVTIQSGWFSLNSPHVIRVSSTVILNILSDIRHTCIFLVLMICDALSKATPELKDLWITHNIKVQSHLLTLLLGFYSMNLFSGENQNTQIEQELGLCPVFHFGFFSLWSGPLLSLRCVD